MNSCKIIINYNITDTKHLLGVFVETDGSNQVGVMSYDGDKLYHNAKKLINIISVVFGDITNVVYQWINVDADMAFQTWMTNKLVLAASATLTPTVPVSARVDKSLTDAKSLADIADKLLTYKRTYANTPNLTPHDAKGRQRLFNFIKSNINVTNITDCELSTIMNIIQFKKLL